MIKEFYTADKINILGTDYEILIDNSLLDSGNDGVCDSLNKRIATVEIEKLLSDNNSIDDKIKRYTHILRHEIIHAFFYECGLQKYFDDEMLTEFLTIQFIKLYDMFDELGILE